VISFGRLTSALGLGPALACFASIASAQIKPQYEEIGPIDVQTRYQRPAAAAYFHVSAGESFQVLFSGAIGLIHARRSDGSILSVARAVS